MTNRWYNYYTILCSLLQPEGSGDVVENGEVMQVNLCGSKGTSASPKKTSTKPSHPQKGTPTKGFAKLKLVSQQDDVTEGDDGGVVDGPSPRPDQDSVGYDYTKGKKSSVSIG